MIDAPSKWLHATIVALGLTEREAAKAVNVSAATIRAWRARGIGAELQPWERRVPAPTWARLEPLVKLLRVRHAHVADLVTAFGT